jgi:hypothetical protein
MNNKEINIDYETEEIRLPDEVKRERLVALEETNIYPDRFEDDINKVIQLSLHEWTQQENSNAEFEEHIVYKHIIETEERRKKFKNILFNMSKIINYDKNMREIYEIITPIIENYCNQVIEHFEFDKTTYDRIFQTLRNIRINKQEWHLLQTIFLQEKHE